MIQERNKEDQELMEHIDRAIAELVYEKTQLIKAYNYYYGKRDPEQFRHLEENYGIGTPTSVEFIPLVRKHIDALVGEYLSTPIRPKVSCKDKKTITRINEEKSSTISNSVIANLKTMLLKAIHSIANNEEVQLGEDQEKSLEDLVESINRDFVSSYEMAGQNIVQYSMQSRDIDFLNKFKKLLIDLLVTGTMYYKVLPSSNGTNVCFKDLNPINTFIDRNPNSPYLKDSARAVIREYLTKQQILEAYGELLTQDDLDCLETLEDYSVDGSTTTYLRSYDSVTGNTITDGVLGGFEITPLLPFERNTSKYFRLFPVYSVEYLKTEKEDGEYITNRYEGVRIGTQIYILTGKSKHITRSISNPNHCTLSINGVFHCDRNTDPFSLILATANLQDKFDVLHFYRDNLIASSGTVGDWLDVAHLPKFLGANVTERLIKWEAYAKTGKKLYDSSQEGNVINTAFNGFDDTIKVQAIQAIDLAIQRVEETTSTITGVFKERIGGIEQRDAVTNVQVGIKNSALVTKQYYQLMDLMTREVLIDILNLSKIVFKKGLSGTLILGDSLKKVFTALPEHYTFTDFDIHIADSSEVIREQETIKQLSVEFIKAGLLDPATAMEVITAKGLTEMKDNVMKSLGKQKQENNQLQQASQQAQQLDAQLKQVSSEAQKLQQEIQRLNSEKLQLEKDKLNFEKELQWFKAKSDDSFKEGQLSRDDKRIQLEAAQLLDNNQKNDEIKNS